MDEAKEIFHGKVFFEQERLGSGEIFISLGIVFLLGLLGNFSATFLQLSPEIVRVLNILLILLAILSLGLCLIRKSRLLPEYIKFWGIENIPQNNSDYFSPSLDNVNETIISDLSIHLEVPVEWIYDFLKKVPTPTFFIDTLQRIDKDSQKKLSSLEPLPKYILIKLEHEDMGSLVVSFQGWLALKHGIEIEVIQKKIGSAWLEKRFADFQKNYSQNPQTGFQENSVPVQKAKQLVMVLQELHYGGMVLLFFTLVTSLLLGQLAGFNRIISPLLLLTGLYYLVLFPVISSTFIPFKVNSNSRFITITLWFFCYLFHIMVIFKAMGYFLFG